jgi:hypothetical protein
VSVAGARSRLVGLLDRVLFMDDGGCEMIAITFDAEGVTDAVLDALTLELVPTVDDAQPLYDGPALIAPDGTRNRVAQSQGGADVFPEWHVCRIPSTAPSIPRGAVVIVASSPKAHLVGRRFTVDGVPDSGRHVTSILSLRSVEPGPRL